jgi:flagellar biogenesis protein FliO
VGQADSLRQLSIRLRAGEYSVDPQKRVCCGPGCAGPQGRRSEKEQIGMEVIRQMAAAAAVLALLGITLWWLRRRGLAATLPGRRGGERRLECVERLPLGPQQTLHLLKLGERGLLVASFPSGCSLLGDYPWRDCSAPALPRSSAQITLRGPEDRQ